MDPNRMVNVTPELHRAAEADRSDLVLSLLKRGADPEEKDGRGWTALNVAALLGNTGVVVTLLAAKANIEATTTTNRYTALHTAADSGHPAVVELLLWKGADITAVTAKGWTALNLAAYAGHHDAVSSLLDRGADINATTTNGGWTALHIAAECGDVSITLLLLRKGADISAVTKRGWNALHCAAHAGHGKAVRTLLDQKADVYSATKSSGYTALHLAAEKAHDGVLTVLLNGGADALAQTKDGQTALDLLAASQKTGTVTSKSAIQSSRQQLQVSTSRTLIGIGSYGLKIIAAAACHQIKGGRFLNESASTSRSFVCPEVTCPRRDKVWPRLDNFRQHLKRMHQLEPTEEFIANAEIEVQALKKILSLPHLDEITISTSCSDSGALHFIINGGFGEFDLLFDLRERAHAAIVLGWLPLHLAVYRGSEETIKTLLDLGADVNAKIVGTDSTALKWAVITNKGSIVRILLQHGADVSKTDNKGWTVLLWAAYYGLNGVVQQLLAHRAAIATSSRNQRWTALHLAAENNFSNTVRTLLDGGADPLALTKDGKSALDVTPKSAKSTRTVLEKAMEEASQAQHTRGVLASQTIRESTPPSLYEIRPDALGNSDEIAPPELSKFIPEVAREQIRNVWASQRQRPLALYDTNEFLERMDNLLSQHAFRQLIQQAREAPLNFNGDKTFLYLGSIKFVRDNVTVTVQAGVDTSMDDNLISENLLSLLGNPPKSSEGLYEMSISALPLEPVLDPALGFVGFPQAEIFKMDPKAKHDAVFGYDFFNFQGKDLLLSAQMWHVVYEEIAMARLQVEASERMGLQEDKFHFVESIRVCRPRNPRPYVKIRATFHTGRERSSVSRDIVRQLGCSGDEQEIPLAFHFISEDRKHVWVFDVVEKLGAELVIGSDWLSSAGQSVLTRRQTSPPIIEPVPTSGKATLDNQDTDLSLASRVRRPASTSPHMANPEFQVGERETSDHRRTSDLAVPDPHYRPQSAPAQAKAENTQMQEIELRCGNTSIVAVAVLDSGCTDDWVSSRFINRLKAHATDQDPLVSNIPTGVAVPTFTDFNGNDKQPGGTIMASWKMTHLNPHLMYDSTFYINDSPNAPFDVLLGSRTLFGKAIYTLSRTIQGSLPLIHKPISLLQYRHIVEGEARTKAEVDRQDAWRRQQEEEEEEDRRRAQARARAR